jgi:hypothetical protein
VGQLEALNAFLSANPMLCRQRSANCAIPFLVTERENISGQEEADQEIRVARCKSRRFAEKNSGAQSGQG